MERSFGNVVVVITSLLLLIPIGIVECLPNTFDVTAYNHPKSDGSVDISQDLLKAWKEACNATEASSVIIPKGTFLLNPIGLNRPCKASSIEFQLQGTLKAPEDPNIFNKNAWLTLVNIDHLTILGGGTFDGVGSKTWANNNCEKSFSCNSLPISLSLNMVTNSVIQDITSKDSKFFHANVLGGKNVTFQHVTISAATESVNTDGFHIGRSSDITVKDSIIGTGDDCVSIGDGSKQIQITNITCGPGHGISIGSLGRYPDEEPVEGVIVKNCTLINTTNGVRIKTWPSSLNGMASDIHFEDIIMQNVTNPILIDQEYCPWNTCNAGKSSNIKLSKINYKNIRGTSANPLAVNFVCSKNCPCEDVEIGDIDLRHEGSGSPITTKCLNIHPIFSGRQIPSICSNTTTQSSL